MAAKWIHWPSRSSRRLLQRSGSREQGWRTASGCTNLIIARSLRSSRKPLMPSCPSRWSRSVRLRFPKYFVMGSLVSTWVRNTTRLTSIWWTLPSSRKTLLLLSHLQPFPNRDTLIISNGSQKLTLENSVDSLSELKILHAATYGLTHPCPV